MKQLLIPGLLSFFLVLPLYGQEEVHPYYLGQTMAERDFKGGGAVITGCVAGFLAGVLGWGVGEAVILVAPVEVPPPYTSEYTQIQRIEFENSYVKTTKKLRSRNFSLGAGVGWVTWFVIYYSSL